MPVSHFILFCGFYKQQHPRLTGHEDQPAVCRATFGWTPSALPAVSAEWPPGRWSSQSYSIKESGGWTRETTGRRQFMNTHKTWIQLKTNNEKWRKESHSSATCWSSPEPGFHSYTAVLVPRSAWEGRQPEVEKAGCQANITITCTCGQTRTVDTTHILRGLGGKPPPGWHPSHMSLNVCIQLQRHKVRKGINDHFTPVFYSTLSYGPSSPRCLKQSGSLGWGRSGSAASERAACCWTGFPLWRDGCAHEARPSSAA